MKLKEYAGILTVTLTGILAFDILWAFTAVEAITSLFLSGMIALAAGIVFAFVVTGDELKKTEEPGPTAEFVDCDGLNVLIQKSRRTA